MLARLCDEDTIMDHVDFELEGNIESNWW
jgi:hypothetical protein